MNKLAAQIEASQKIANLFTENLDDYESGDAAGNGLLQTLGTDNWALSAQSYLNVLQLRIAKATWISTEAQQAAGRAFNEAHNALQAARFAEAN